MGIKNKTFLKPLVYAARLFGRNFPELMVRLRYFVRFRRPINLKHPQTLNEKILSLSLRSDTTIWTRLADKYNVRGYIEEHGLSDILVPLVGYWTKAEDIDFDKLPNSFVLKTTQGSGDIIIVKDKDSINKDNVRKQMDKALHTKYGELEGGKHYMRISPAIIAEALLTNDEISKIHSTSIIDYKIWCFNGKVHYIWACCNRDKNGTDVMTYDINWNAHPEYSVFYDHYRRGSLIPKPENFEQMINIAETLAKPFPVVRVDLYNLNGKIYFGEMTFTSLGGLMNFYTDDFQRMCGNIIDLNYKG